MRIKAIRIFIRKIKRQLVQEVWTPSKQSIIKLGGFWFPRSNQPKFGLVTQFLLERKSYEYYWCKIKQNMTTQTFSFFFFNFFSLNASFLPPRMERLNQCFHSLRINMIENKKILRKFFVVKNVFFSFFFVLFFFFFWIPFDS